MNEKKLRTVMKFDTGADGFQYMMWVLAILAIVTLILGTVFILRNF